MGNGPSIEDHLFNLKYTSKGLVRSSKKCEKEERIQRGKIKTAIEKGNMDGARIYAENAIRSKNQALNYLRLASRIDAVANRVETAVRMKSVTKSMAGVTKGMEAVLKSMDTEQISKLMDKFETQFEDLDVTSKYMEDSMATSVSMSAPVDQVDSLIGQVADEHGLEVIGELDGAAVPSGTQVAQGVDEQDDLNSRLQRLKSKP